jgi:hypothetical protein
VLHPGARMVVHVVPVSTFAAGRTLDIVQEVESNNVMALPPGRLGHPNDYQLNLDGLVTFANPFGGAQLFRTGAVEGVDVLHIDEDTKGPSLIGATFRKRCRVGAARLLHVRQILGARLPGGGFRLVLRHGGLPAKGTDGIRR